MLGAVPSFPPIDGWQKMSEREQDALVQAIEATRRRRSRLLLGLACLLLLIALAAHVVPL